MGGHKASSDQLYVQQDRQLSSQGETNKEEFMDGPSNGRDQVDCKEVESKFTWGD